MTALFAFLASPGIGAAYFLWVREAAQENKSDFIEGMKFWNYSAQKHAEIWPPAVAVELIWRLIEWRLI